MAAIAGKGITAIDMVVWNLYPFAGGRGRRRPRGLIENIDIGGPTMIRGAAKNHEFVAVVTEPGRL